MTAPPEVSVILPCYRAAGLAQGSVAQLAEFLPIHFGSWEVVVVDDGGGDFDADARAAFKGPARLIELPENRGKGAAVRAGMLAASGRVRVFTDVDLPFGPDAIPLAAEFVGGHGFHLAVGDRTLPQSRYELNVGWRRRLASAIFSSFVGTFLTGGFFDTQCGFKAFRDDVADAIFGVARIDRFASDVELLYVALSHRADIKRVPVELRSNSTSSVRIVRDSLRMLADVVRIRAYARRGHYRRSPLAAIVQRDLEAARERLAEHPAGGRAARS